MASALSPPEVELTHTHTHTHSLSGSFHARAYARPERVRPSMREDGAVEDDDDFLNDYKDNEQQEI